MAFLTMSDCCGATADDWYENIQRCPDCKENCGFEEVADEDQVNRLIANEREYSGPDYEPTFRRFIQDAPNHIAGAALGLLAFVIFGGLLFAFGGVK